MKAIELKKYTKVWKSATIEWIDELWYSGSAIAN